MGFGALPDSICSAADASEPDDRCCGHCQQPRSKICNQLGNTGCRRRAQRCVQFAVRMSWDGKKLAVKEKIAYIEDGMWKTNLLVYDFSKKKMRELPEVREAIKYYWLKQENLDLNEVRWDIYPIGWDALNPDRIIVFAYAYTGEHPKYLGAWSIDYEGDRTKQMSLTGTSFEVSQNGSALKLIPPY